MRFCHRPKRLARRDERDWFRFMLVPVAWLSGVVGLGVLASVGLQLLVNGEFEQVVFAAGMTLTLFPVFVGGYRLLRGHFDSDLNEP